jgi:hypothetical protein
MPYNKKKHMTGLLAICWAIWKSRNAKYFEKKQLSLLLRLFVWLPPSLYSGFLAGLHKGGDKQDLEAGAKAMRLPSIFTLIKTLERWMTEL